MFGLFLVSENMTVKHLPELITRMKNAKKTEKLLQVMSIQSNDLRHSC